MSNIPLFIRSYSSAAMFAEVVQRLPALMIALWLGVISISMIPHIHIIEGGFLFLFFFISCLLIDSVFNPKKLKNPKIARAVRTIGRKNYILLILIHLSVTLAIAAYLSYTLIKVQIMLIICLGFTLNIINSRFFSRSHYLEKMPNITGVIGGIILPMIGAFYVVGNDFDLFTLVIIGGIGMIYMGIDLFNQTQADLEVAPEQSENNSIEWEAMSICNKLGLPNNRIKEIAIQLYNIRNEAEFFKIPKDKCILFLPHCLRIAERCKATYNEEGLQCKRCSKICKINLLTNEAEKLGYKSFVVPGGAMVFNIVKKYRPEGVVAVACPNELSEGTERVESEYKVPFQIIPLNKDGCVNTDVCTEEVMDIMSHNFNINLENN